MAVTSQVNIRCTEEQHARWSAAAQRAKRKLADWARLQIDKGADEEMLEDSSAAKAGKRAPGPRR